MKPILYCLSAALFVLNLTTAAAAPQVLKGHVPAAIQGLSPVGDLPPDKRLRLAVGLPLRDEAGLNGLLGELYNPGSQQYRQFILPEEFTARFCPTAEEYSALARFLAASGLQVTSEHPNRLIVDVSGSVAELERLLHTRLRVYQHPSEPRTFYAPETAPWLDAPVAVLDVSGLDDYSLPRPQHRLRPSPNNSGLTPHAGSGPGGSYRGNDFRAAYVPGTALNGAGQSVGLLQFDGYYANDITTYANQAGLPVPTLVNVAVDGGVSTPGGGNSEVALDIEMVMSMAPNISKIYVYEAPNPSPWVDLLSRMANDNLAKQLSCSWGGGGPNASAEQIFKQMAAQGQSFYNATGDSDAFTGSISFPSDSTNITQVGGTTLSTTGPGGSYVSETVWNWGLVNGNYVGSSGGVSTYYGIPDYQLGLSMVANQGSTTMRNVPDVALTGDNVYVVYNNGSSGVFGGTSCAAPLWAGVTALINQQATTAGKPVVGFINRAVYAMGKGSLYASSFHDTTTGNNFSSSSPTKYAAVAGYDLCTGWGTPNGSNFINALTRPIMVTNAFMLVAESYSPANGAVDPGETVTVNFTIQNMGSSSSSALLGTLLPGGGVTAPSAAQAYGVVAGGGGTATQPFTFTASGTCGGIVTATLQLQDGGVNAGTLSFPMRLGRLSIPLTQNFDAVTAPALPSGWATSTSGAQPLWVTSAAASDTTPNSAFTSGANAAGVNELVSPAFPVTSTTAQLSFRNSYNFQAVSGSRGDGGVLEISIGGAAFTDILSAGGTFLSGGYTATLSSNRGNPLGGRQAWNGNSGGFITTLVQLPASAAGQTVQLKWRCGTDSSTSSVGWYIDSVAMTDANVYLCNLPSTDLAVSQSAPASPLVAGSNFTYSITVTNLGTAPASSVVVTDTLSAGVTFVSASPTYTLSAGQVVFALGSLNAASATNLSLTVRPTSAGTLTNTVTVASAGTDPNLANNSSTLVWSVLSQPSLVAGGPGSGFGYVAVGQSATQTWILVNGGQANLNGSVNTHLPFSVAGGSPFTLAGGQTGYVTIAFSPVADVAYADTVVFTSNGGNSTNAVNGIGAYPVTANFAATPLSGLAPLKVVFSDYSTGTITNRSFDFGDGTSTNSTVTAVQHTYLAASTNDVSLTVSGPLGTASLTRPAYVVATNGVADLSLSMTAAPEPVFAGRSLVYTLSLSNLGPESATAVVITNSLPLSALLLSATATPGVCTNYGQEVVCNIGTLSNGATASVVLTVAPTATEALSLITNLASVSALEADPITSNNLMTLVSTVWLDSVGDGIPDWWRVQYFGSGASTNATSCATCDPDGDRFSNLAEFIADTNPTNSASYLAVAASSASPNSVRLQWHGGTAARQFVQRRYDLSSTNEAWLDILTNEPPTPLTGSLTNELGTNSVEFFRIRAVRP